MDATIASAVPGRRHQRKPAKETTATRIELTAMTSRWDEKILPNSALLSVSRRSAGLAMKKDSRPRMRCASSPTTFLRPANHPTAMMAPHDEEPRQDS
ncbi:MAG: hypothetical protein M3P18_05850 [Actinomycetota bacterium]|nr:hypothetical protein [Actinomycetota bacterium]